jgi:hypothetical protein
MTATPDLMTLIVGIVAAAIFIGVVLPAVWSASPERRAAALATLKELLTIVRRSQ